MPVLFRKIWGRTCAACVTGPHQLYGASGGSTSPIMRWKFSRSHQTQTIHLFLKSDTALPMMYMPDAIRATISLMEAPAEQVKIRTAYNVAGSVLRPPKLRTKS